MKSFWDFYALIYDILKSFIPYQKLQRYVVDYLDLIPYLKIADCGCGTGNTISGILEKKKWKTEIVGFERSPAMLNRAKRKIKEGDNIKFIEGDFEDISIFEGKKYDRIVSVNSLYTVSDPSVVLKNWFNVLNDGGLVVIVNPFIPKLSPVFNEFFSELWTKKDIRNFIRFFLRLPIWWILILINKYIAKKAKDKKFHFLKPEKLISLAETCGFSVINKKIVYGKGSILISLQKDVGNIVRRAHTSSELNVCYRIRYNVYCEGIESLKSEDYPEKEERDVFDDYAAHFIWREDNTIVGCIRLIPDYGDGFLLENGKNFPVPSHIDKYRKKTLEFSRMAVLSSHRQKNIGYILAEAAAQWSFHGEYSERWIAMCQKRVWDGFSSNNWDVDMWGKYIFYHNTYSSPGSLIPPFLSPQFKKI